MTNKVNKSNGFAQDMIRNFTMSNRTHKSQISYFTEMFANNCQYNVDKKKTKIEQWELEKLELYKDHKENGTLLDMDRILQLNNDIGWYEENIAVAESLKDYFQTASQQMFPEEHQKSEQVDDALAKLEEQYKAQKAAS